MNTILRRLALGLLLAGSATAANAQVSLTALDTASTQDFNTLPTSGSATWTNNSTLAGWFHARTGTGTTIVANNGSSNAGNLYSYGTGTNTDRALGALGSGNAAIGNLFYGIRLQNNTGSTITSLDVSFTGEQWRNSAAAGQTVAFSYVIGSPTVTGSLTEFQGAGTADATLNFTGPITGGAAGALDGNLAANRTAISATISDLNIPDGTEIMLRWADPDHTGADHGLAIDDFSVTPHGEGEPTGADMSITMVDSPDPVDAEGLLTYTITVANAGPESASTVGFSMVAPTGTSPVSMGFTGAAWSGSCNLVSSTFSCSTESFPAGSTQIIIQVSLDEGTVGPIEATATVTTESQEGNVANNTVMTSTAVTLPPVAIHDIQGAGRLSPLDGQEVTTEGIVTAIRLNNAGTAANGFYIQAPDAEVDANAATSEGIFVFTSSAPPAAVVVGARVRVAGTVDEFTPAARPHQQALTELVTVTVTQLSTGNPLPTAVELTDAELNAGSAVDSIERYEGMRAAVATLTVVGASSATLDENDALSPTRGLFWGVIPPAARPFREPGIGILDTTVMPPGVDPPDFDTNPERLQVDTRGQLGGVALSADTGAEVTGLVGVLDYDFGSYLLRTDPSAEIAITGGATPTAVSDRAYEEVTIGGFNLLRFFDTVDDDGVGDVVLTEEAFANRLKKTSNAICAFVKTPDILGVVEVDNINALTELADAINDNLPGTCDEDIVYVPYLMEGNDVGGIDIGFLVRTDEVSAGTPRVSVIEVVQLGLETEFTNPNASTDPLNDRPPLMLRAVVNQDNGASYPVTVIATHQRSLGGVNDTAVGGSGWPTGGARVRAKRVAQAMFLADVVEDRQAADADEHIVLLGDFNAFEFNDGYGDVMGIVTGREATSAEVLNYADSPIVRPLTNMTTLSPAEDRYSFMFEGSAQTLDHIVVNQPILDEMPGTRTEHARINSDFGEDNFGDFSEDEGGQIAVPVRVSDHDPVVLYLAVPAFRSADLSAVVDAPASPVAAGSLIEFDATIANAGPNEADNALVTFLSSLPLPALSVVGPAGWTCEAAVPNGGGTSVDCGRTAFALESAEFTISAQTTPAQGGQTLTLTATASSDLADPNPANNVSSDAVTLRTANANLAVSMFSPPPALVLGRLATVNVRVSNLGLDGAYEPRLAVTITAPVAKITPVVPEGWGCVVTTSTATNTAYLCSFTGTFAAGAGSTVSFAIQTQVPLGVTVGAGVSSQTPDAVSSNNKASAKFLMFGLLMN